MDAGGGRAYVAKGQARVEGGHVEKSSGSMEKCLELVDAEVRMGSGRKGVEAVQGKVCDEQRQVCGEKGQDEVDARQVGM